MRSPESTDVLTGRGDHTLRRHAETMAGTHSNNVKMFGKVALDCGWLQTSSTKSNMPIRPQEIGRRSGNLRPFHLRIILCVNWNRVNMQQLAPARHLDRTIRLTEQKQVEARVVQLLE